MAKLNLNSYSKNKMADEFVNKVASGNDYKKVICLFRKDMTNSVDFNSMNAIDLGGQYSNDNLTINGLQNFKELQLVNNNGKVELGTLHEVNSSNDIGNYYNVGALVWAIPGMRNADWIVIGSYSHQIDTLISYAAIQLSPSIPPSSDVKTFLISNLSIEFKGDGA